MKFRVLLMLFFVFTVESFAQDYLRLNPKSITLTKNNWGDMGDGDAELKLFFISESYSGTQTKLTIPAEKTISASLDEEKSLGQYSGLSIPLGSDIVHVYIIAVDEDKGNRAVSVAENGIITLMGKLIEKDSLGLFKKFKRANRMAYLASKAVEFGLYSTKEYLESNDILGTWELEFYPSDIKSRDGITRRSQENSAKLVYDIELIKKGSSSSSSQSTSSSKWVTPTNSTCRANGGKLYKGVCRATWEDAKKICRASGGRLPSIEELKEAVSDCGGTVTKSISTKIADENMENKAYQSCYKNKGFIYSDYCWSSSTIKGNEDNAWIVYFGYGGVEDDLKYDNAYIRCVRDGQ